MARVVVKQTPDKEVPVEIIASAIVDIGAAMRKLNASRLSREALVILISHASKVGQRDVRTVLDNLDQLESHWLKPKKKA